MNKVDIVRKYIGNDDFYDMNGTPLLTKILAAMDEYAQQQVKNCSIPDIVLRSEQLKAFVRWVKANDRHIVDGDFGLIDDYLKSL